MIEVKIDTTINIPELASDSQQEIKAFGGYMPIRSEDIEDYDPEIYKAKVKVHPKAEMNLELQQLSAKLLKDMCKDKKFCSGCSFYDEGCKIANRPELWRI